MKKAILFVLALILLSVVTNAQTKRAFDENTRLINVGIGLGGNYHSFSKSFGYSQRRSPIVCVSYEQPYKKRLGPGFLGIGGFLSFQRSVYKYDDNYYFGERYYYQHSYNNFVLAARAVYHWDGLNAENAEVYGGAIAGVRIQTYNYDSNYPGANKDYYRVNSGGGAYPVFSVFAGARWYFVPRVAVFGELSAGTGIPFASGGLTFKL